MLTRLLPSIPELLPPPDDSREATCLRPGAIGLVAWLVDGWMPRTRRLDSDTRLAASTSEPLHRFHPERYPIWDGRVRRALEWRSAVVRADPGDRSPDDIVPASQTAGREEFRATHRFLEQHIGRPVRRMRSRELLLFLGGRVDQEE